MRPENDLYTESHEWVRRENGDVRVGITDHAVEELQDLVYLSLKSPSTHVDKEEPIGEIESVKAVADIYAPVSGEITAVNEEITSDLDTLYNDPFDAGWLVKLVPDDEEKLNELMTLEEYNQYIAEQE